jgi:TonB family protein
MSRGAYSAVVLIAVLATAHADPPTMLRDGPVDPEPGAALPDKGAAASGSVPAAPADASGGWRFRLVRGGPLELGTGVLIENASDQTLECAALVTWQFGGGHQMTLTRATVVKPRVSRMLISVVPPDKVGFNPDEGQCKVRVTPPPLPKLAPECHAQVVHAGDVANYYPVPSRRLGEVGQVVLEFTLDKEDGPPANVHVLLSSLYARLDEAGVRLVEDTEFRTTCPGTMQRMPVNFALRRP